jgi:hypothetical protein
MFEEDSGFPAAWAITAAAPITLLFRSIRSWAR